MIRYNILGNKRVTLICFTGIVYPEDVIGFINTIAKDPAYDTSFNSIFDLRNADLSYDVEGLRKTLNHVFTAEGFQGNRKTVFITSNANQLVPPMMLSSQSDKLAMQIEVASTVEAALRFVEIKDFTQEDYLHELNKLCQK